MDTSKHRRGLATLSLLLAVTVVPVAGAASLEVKIDSGEIEGFNGKETGIRVFEGIPFAAPPVGAFRWREPQPVTPWSGVRKTTKFGPRPMQGRIFSDMVFRDQLPSEDCLYLNVWTPAKTPDEKLPVMVWIYGGGFMAGATSEPRQDGTHLATKGVVVVSMNYRLGIFGFFAHPELSAESGRGSSGNYGIMDQTAALRWVQRNIAAFGGDPSNVTIFGESAGSYSVSLQMATPTAKGLFERAIGESGSMVGTHRIPARVLTLVAAEQQGVEFMKWMGCANLGELRAKPGVDVQKASLADKNFKVSVDVDGYVLPKFAYDIYAKGEQAHIPLLAGWNADESRVYATFGTKMPTAKSFSEAVTKEYAELAPAVLKLYPADTDIHAVRSAGDLAGDRFIVTGTWNWIEMQRKTGVPVYRYRFDRQVPVPDDTEVNGQKATAADVGASHASEIPYVFRALPLIHNVTWEKPDYVLSDLMATYWTNFAKTGNPNGPGVPLWPQYQEATQFQVMHLDILPKAEPEQNRLRHAFWDQAPVAHPVANPVGHTS